MTRALAIALAVAIVAGAAGFLVNARPWEPPAFGPVDAPRLTGGSPPEDRDGF